MTGSKAASCRATSPIGAYTGTGAFADREPVPGLRALASLYVESMHLVVRAESGIESVADLRGRRVSLDSRGSGTQIDALLILEAHGLAHRRPRGAPCQAGAGDPADGHR
jgi:uncharacterized protein